MGLPDVEITASEMTVGVIRRLLIASDRAMRHAATNIPTGADNLPVYRPAIRVYRHGAGGTVR